MTKSEIRIFAHKQTLGTGKATAKYAGDTVNYIKVHFNLDENWDGYDSIRAVWANKATISTLLDSNNDCVIPFEVLANKGDVMVNLIASKVENGEVTDRFTSYPFVACSITADVVLNGSETVPIIPSQFEQFVEAVKDDADRAEQAVSDSREQADRSETEANRATTEADRAEDEADNALASAQNAHASELRANGYASDAQQSAESAQGYAQNASESAISAENAKDDAEDARDVILGMRAVATILPEGSEPTARFENGVLYLGIPKGDTGEKGNKGDTGNGISSITKTGTSGLVDTYTITYTNGQTTTFTVTNGAKGDTGNGIASIEKTSTAGLVDTYTITYTNGTTTTFTVTNGEKGDKGDTGEVSLEQLSELLPTDTASGSIASFPDGQSVIPAVSVKAEIEPIQDLHGYDKPWVGGAGVNLVDSDILINGTYNKYNIPNPLKNGQTYTYSVYGDNTFGYGLFAGHTNTAVPQPNIPVVNRYVFAGNHVTFTAPDDIEEWEYLFLVGSANGAGSKEIQAQIEKGTVANPTYHPYSNICPISGKTEVVTHRTGKNLLDTQYKTYTAQNNVRYYRIGGGGIKLYAGVTYTLSVSEDNTRPSGIYINEYGPDVSARETYARAYNSYSVTYMPTKDVVIETDCFYTTAPPEGIENIDVQLEVGNTATDYEPYNGNTYTTSLGRTVYGGTLDVVSGVLTVDRAMVDLGTLNWTYDATVPRFYSTNIKTTVKAPLDNSVVNAISSDYIATSFNELYVLDKRNGTFAVGATGTLSIINTSYTDATAFKTAMNGVQLVYELATPQTIQLTPQEVELLKGQNNLWCDSGNIEVTYKADIQKYIEKKLG